MVVLPHRHPGVTKLSDVAASIVLLLRVGDDPDLDLARSVQSEDDFGYVVARDGEDAAGLLTKSVNNNSVVPGVVGAVVAMTIMEEEDCRGRAATMPAQLPSPT